MLTITQIHYIRKLYFDKGKSITEIEKATGHNYRTIKKFIECEDFNEVPKIKTRKTKSDLIRPFVRSILETDKNKKKKFRHTAKVIYKRALAEEPELCQISSRTMRTIVNEERKLIYNDNECFLDLQHPGGEAQVDFGEVYITINGESIKAHEFVLSFPNSNAGYCQITRSETAEALFESLTAILEHVGQVPSKIWFDQMAAAVIRTKNEHGEAIATETLIRYSTHYGFEPVFCNPYSGNEKGNVESKVGYFRRNLFVYDIDATNLEKANRDLLEKCDKDNEEPHYELSIGKNILLEKEKTKMRNLPLEPYDSCKIELRRVDKYGHIAFDKNHYSVSLKYVAEKIRVVVKANMIILQDKNHKEITRHKRSFRKNQKFTHWADFIDMISYRPRALKYSGFYNLLPPKWKVYTENRDDADLKEALRFLKFCMIHHNMEMAEAVLSENLEQSVLEPEALWTSLYRLKENTSLYNGQLKEDHFPVMPAYKSSLDDYNMLLGRRQ